MDIVNKDTSLSLNNFIAITEVFHIENSFTENVQTNPFQLDGFISKTNIVFLTIT